MATKSPTLLKHPPKSSPSQAFQTAFFFLFFLSPAALATILFETGDACILSIFACNMLTMGTKGKGLELLLVKDVILYGKMAANGTRRRGT
jgi:hypothetical protein